MATTIQAAQISTNSTSWYQKLRKIQAKTNKYYGTTTKMTQTTDPAITAGSKATAEQMNAFLTALNGIKSNEFLAYADWTKQVNSVTAGTKIESSVKSNIDTILTSLQGICSQYSTEQYNYCSTTPYYNCSDYTTYTNCPDYGQWSPDIHLGNICSQTACSTYGYCDQCATCSNNTTWSETVGNSTYNDFEVCSTYNHETGNSTNQNTGTCNTYGQDSSNSTNGYDGDSTYWQGYNTENGGYKWSYDNADGWGKNNYVICENAGNAVNSNNATWSFDGLSYSQTSSNSTWSHSPSNATYNQSSGNSTYDYDWFNATAEYTRQASACTTCNYMESNSTYSQTYGGNNTWNETMMDCDQCTHSPCTNTAITGYNYWYNVSGYSTYNVSGNSVYSN